MLFAQKKVLDEFFISLRNENFNHAKAIIPKLDLKNNTCKEAEEFYFLIELLENKGVTYNNKSLKKNYTPQKCSKNKIVNIISKINFALYNYYFVINSDISVHSIYTEVLNEIKGTNYTTLKGLILRRILEYHNNIFVLEDHSFNKYIDMYLNLAVDDIDIAIANFYKLTIGIKNTESYLQYNDFLTAKELSEKLKINSYNTKLKVIAGNYLEEKKQNVEALKYYYNALNQISKDSTGTNILMDIHCNMNLGIFHYYDENFEKALQYFTAIKNLKGKLIDRKKIYFDYWLSLTYEKLKKYDKAYQHLKTSRRNQFSFNQENHLRAIRDIEAKYETEKKEKENLQLKTILLVSTLFVVLGLLVTYLTLKNSRRKRMLAEQQKELEKQKNLTLLKEQEINTINAMVAGQEKERVRIAEDLHDNIGSVLATLKLHFENLKLNREKKHFNQEELYEKTEKLIDETYLKVRTLAHAKNAGVIANKGLLVAIKLMTEKVSASNKFSIEVVSFGLEHRLDSNTEITIFRIVQELITNIIKHAEATKATINISLFDNTLNLIIEDNGKGFDFHKVKLINGMGLGSIQKRIDHLKGTFLVDSTLQRGTSIIINLPI